MVFEGSSAAISHTGKVRYNNQDSGFAGSNLFVVADGMGGHAGGDIASALAITTLQELDRAFDTPANAQDALQAAIWEVADTLVHTAQDRPELHGLGTTVDAILMVDNYAVIGHIGDSRIYLYRDETLTQVTTDHSFVQRLVDAGRITPEEARYHPRRNVVMRVLTSMDSQPDIDMMIMPTRPGDRWLVCSDGLSGVVDDAHVAKVLKQGSAPGATADALLKQALDAGAPDNVTIVLVDVGGQHPLYSGKSTIVGSAANPQGVVVPTKSRQSTGGWLHPVRQAANAPSHFEPSHEYLEELIEEDARRLRNRRWAWATGLTLVLAMLATGLWLGYRWTQERFFVGADHDSVVIYQGIPQDLGPIRLSSVHEDTGIDIESLPTYSRIQVERTIPAHTIEDAQLIVDRLRTLAGDQ